MNSARPDDDFDDLPGVVSADAQEPDVNAPPGSEDMEAAASIHFQFQVDRLALRHAFLATRLARASDRVRMRISTDHVTLAAQNKSMRCEADVTFFGTSRVAADQAIVVETQAALFANFLCNPHLWNGNRKARGKAVTFAVNALPTNSGEGEPLQPGRWQIKAGHLDIDWPFTYVGSEETSDAARTGSLVRTDEIVRALALVYKFSEHSHSAPQFGQVQVRSSRASAGSPASARVVTFPIHLAGVDLRVARENAGDLLEVLRQFDPLATQMWVTEVEQGFCDASRRCTVARASEGPDFDRLHDHAPIGLAIARNLDFNNSMCKIISQTSSDTDVVRLALSGEEERKLRFSVAVNGGTAVVTCPVQRVRIENDTSPSETRELWLRGDALADTVALPRANEIELHLFEHQVLFKQEDDNPAMAETFLFAQKAPRPVPSSER
jgi:hypothetical protein